MKRRAFISLLGGAALVASVTARAQRTPPVVGVLSSGPPGPLFENAIEDGLRQTGYIKGQNVQLEYRFASGSFDKIPLMMSELLDLKVSVVHALGTVAARQARDTIRNTSSPVPLIFSFGGDPVGEGMVASLNRPGGNITGITSIGGSLGPKRLELLRQLVGSGTSMALLINPRNAFGLTERNDVEAAARSLGQSLEILSAADDREIEGEFAKLRSRSIGALIIAVDTLYYGRMRQMAELAAKFGVPTIGPLRDFADAGGLVSYGASIYDVNRQAATYVGRILKGEKPAELPVLQPTKFALVLNLKAAKALGLTVPQNLQVAADDVIE